MLHYVKNGGNRGSCDQGNIEVTLVVSVFIGGSENQQSLKSGSSDIIMTRFFLTFVCSRVFFSYNRW